MSQYRAKKLVDGSWVVQKFEGGRLLRYADFSGPRAEQRARDMVLHVNGVGTARPQLKEVLA